MNSTDNAINMSDLSEFYIESSTNTTAGGNYCSPASVKHYHYYTLAEDIYFYGLLVIIPFGLVGNIFSMVVFLLSAVLRRTTTGQFLVALAVADSTVLVGDAIRWLASRRYMSRDYYFPHYLGLNFVHTSDAACRLTYFLRYGGNLWSVWLTIAISVERLIAVALPLKIGHLSTSRRTRILVACIGIVSFALGSFPFWTMHSTIREICGVDMLQCKILDEGAYNAWNTAVVRFSTLLIPGVLIVVLTVVIVALLFRARRLRNAQLSASHAKPREAVARWEVSMETQLTVMLVAVCISTIALRAPYTIAYYVRSNTWNMTAVDPMTKATTYVAYRVTDMVNTCNYAINFILYCLCGSSFRREARKVFCKATFNRNSRMSQPQTEDICLSDVQRKSTGSISRENLNSCRPNSKVLCMQQTTRGSQ